MKALILVDIQNDFMPGGGLAIQNGNEVVSLANQMIEVAKQNSWCIVATQDWHPANHGSFASNNEGAKPFTMGELDGVAQVWWTDHCIQGTEGAEFHPDLQVDGVTVVRKGTNPMVDSYSAFFDNARKGETELLSILKENEVDEVILCGLATDYCVAFTALDAIALGYRVKLVVDATRPVHSTPEIYNMVLSDLKSKGIDIVNTKDVLEMRV